MLNTVYDQEFKRTLLTLNDYFVFVKVTRVQK